ncbi:MAG: hypothetical protein L3K03_07995 [Thermoplasmata archaeon]|nr:hypothetical protein [Thermoplasmata archaeon]
MLGVLLFNIVFAYSLLGSPFQSSGTLEIYSGGLAIVAIAWIMLENVVPWKVRASQSGVELQYLVFGKVAIPWNRLGLNAFQPAKVNRVVYLKDSGEANARSRVRPVTLEQAKGIGSVEIQGSPASEIRAFIQTKWAQG